MHFEACQPRLSKYESGFLELGHYPAINHTEFKMTMKVIGISEYPKVPGKTPGKEGSSAITDSEEHSDHLSLEDQNDLGKEQVFSQESFGLTSQNSQTSKKPLTNRSRSKKTPDGSIQSDASDISRGSTIPTQKCVDKYFSDAKRAG